MIGKKAAEFLERREVVGVLALVDQSLYSATNFILQIIVARAVSDEEFGAYSVGSIVFFVAALIHQTCVIEPMFVFSARRYGDRVEAYQARLKGVWSIGFGLIVLVCSLAISVVIAELGSPRVASAVAAFGAASPVLLYFWLLRRICFLRRRLDMAVAGGVLYALIVVGCGLLLWQVKLLSAATAILLSGGAAVPAALLLRAALPSRGAPEPVPGMLRAHLRYGRWAAASEAINLLMINGPLVVLPIWFGLAASAQFRVINLLYMPLQQIVSAMIAILLRRYSFQEGAHHTLQATFAAVALLGGGALLYAFCVVATSGALAPLIFGSKYSMDSAWLVLAGVYLTFFIATQGFFVAMRAQEKTHQVFAVHVAALMVGTALLPLCAARGIEGVLQAQSVAWAAAFLIAGALTIRGASQLAGPSASKQESITPFNKLNRLLLGRRRP